MSRKKKHEHVNHERWLVSYADFSTLLFAFFVVLFASGQSDKKKVAELGGSIHAAFDQMGLFDVHSKTPSLTSSPGAAPTAEAAPLAIPLPLPGAPRDKVAVKEHIDAAAKEQIARGTVAVRQGEDGLVVSLKEAGFFDSGAAGVRPEALAVVERLIAALPQATLRVEGHTDDVPISTAQFASNWELSSARASSIARLLLRDPKVDPARLSVAGYAEFHPVASNATADGRARNRRVDIVVLGAK